jgi:predicted nucleotidyltransferase
VVKDMNPYYSFLEQREETARKKAAEFQVKTKERLDQAVKQITEQYPAIEQIVVFGSLVDDSFNEASDIDIYMEGLPSAHYFEARRLLEEITDLDIDLYNQGDRPEFIERVKKRGVIVYERKTGTIDSQSK